jgi:phosphatidate cytidylyltransferase
MNEINEIFSSILYKRRRHRIYWQLSTLFLVYLGCCCIYIEHQFVIVEVVECFPIPIVNKFYNLQQHQHQQQRQQRNSNHHIQLVMSNNNFIRHQHRSTIRTTKYNYQSFLHQSKQNHDVNGNNEDVTISSNMNNDYDENNKNQKQQQQQQQQHKNIAQRLITIYSEYASRLWNETSIYERQRVGQDQLASSIRQVQSKLKSIAIPTSKTTPTATTVISSTTPTSDTYSNNNNNNDNDDDYDDDNAYIDIEPTARENLLSACEEVLKGLQIASRQRRKNTTGSSNTKMINFPSTIQINGGLHSSTSSTTTTTTESPTNAVSVSLPTKEQSAAVSAAAAATDGNAIPFYEPNGLSTRKTTTTDNSITLTSNDDGTSTAAAVATATAGVATKKKSRSVAFGALMGAVVALWVFSGNYIFTGLFTLMTILGQLEYYRMIMNTGVSPARRISVLGACSMFLSALLCPDLHQLCLPMFGLWTMIWFLTCKQNVSTIAEIATTFTGMFYLGYVPSFWVRIRLFGPAEPTRLAPVVKPLLNLIRNTAQHAYILPKWAPQAIHLPITTGSVFIFWTWLSLAFSDVGAYFVGKKYGKTKLHVISPAAGATSPNKTIEGVIGGCVTSALLAIIGAWVQRWPYPIITGTIHGILLGMLGLIGDLTASMLKRDAGLKDFGDLLPEHGGILDRVDSFIWSAPYSWLVCTYIIPALKQTFR